MLAGQRIAVQGIVSKFSYKRYNSGTRAPTLILRSVVTPDGDPLCDHLWMNYTKAFAALSLAKGAVVALEGRVTPYTRADGSQDYDLHYARRVRLVTPAPLPVLTVTPIAEIAGQLQAAQQVSGAIGQALLRLQEAGAAGDGMGAYAAFRTACYHLETLKETLQTARESLKYVERSN